MTVAAASSAGAPSTSSTTTYFQSRWVARRLSKICNCFARPATRQKVLTCKFLKRSLSPSSKAQVNGAANLPC